MVFQTEINISTTGHRHIEDLTGRIERIVKESNVQQGLVHIFNVGSTATVGTIEFEPGLCTDLAQVLDRLIPPGRDYGHEQAWHDGNAHSHLQATTIGPGITVPIHRGRMVLGTWQQIFHLECDIAPRKRTVVVTIIGD